MTFLALLLILVTKGAINYMNIAPKSLLNNVFLKIQAYMPKLSFVIGN